LARFLKKAVGHPLGAGRDSSRLSYGSFGPEMRRGLVEAFAVAYYNGSIKPNLAEKNPATGRDAEYLMDAPQFEKVKKSEVWAYSTAVGTGYQYRVVYRDKRFSDLDRLLEMYSGGSSSDDGDQPSAEERLYRILLVLIKEGRLPQTFKVQPPKDPRVDSLTSTVERLSQSVGDLEKRLKKLEEGEAPQTGQALPSETPVFP
jgi:hypothetical protein